MSVWDDVAGQTREIEPLRRAAASAAAGEDGAAMSNAWLVTGPPGSGRSTAARAFAAALECDRTEPGAKGCGECHSCRTALAGSHPDVRIVSTQTLSIRIAEVRELVQLAQRAPSVGRWRVIVMEDADRMSAGTFNVLLKSIEEPPPRTVWILCAPSPQDLAPTIRSRCRLVTLRVPSAEAVADLLVRRDGADPERARLAARAAQSHIGIARRLALSDAAAQRRRDAVSLVFDLESAGQAVLAAARLHDEAQAEAKDSGDERNAAERRELLRTLGIEDGSVPPQARAAVRQLEEEQKKRQTRIVRDVLDRSIQDIYSVFRDALTIQLGTRADLVNEDFDQQIRYLAGQGDPRSTLAAMEAVQLARTRITQNVAPLLALEAMLCAVTA